MNGGAAPDLGPLATAILLADPQDAPSLDVLRKRFAGLDPSCFGAEAETVTEIVAGALELIDRMRAGECTDGEAILDELGRTIADLTEITSGGVQPPAGAAARAGETVAPTPETLAEDTALLLEFADSAIEYLDSVDSMMLTLEQGDDANVVDAVFRAFHTIKGMAGFLGLNEIGEVAHEAESALADARTGTASLGSEQIDAVFASVATLRGLVATATGAADPGAVTAAGSSPSGAAPAQTPVRGTVKASSERRRGTVRVDERRLDMLLDTIGELVIAEASAAELLKESATESEPLAAQMSHLDKISRQLQEMATSMRMVTLRTSFRRMARLVRDLARDAGKQVDCELIGEDIELDKSIVDGISDALVHLIRNAVDHGVETPERRRAAGKPPAAQITIAAEHRSGSVVISVADDGAGLDREAIVAKARERGVIDASDTPSPDAEPLLIFEPGLSTAGAVTEISGRGVGMDVIRKAVDDLRGAVSVTSSPGHGTTVQLTLPLTLAVIDGMVIRVSGERYIVPALSIIRTISIQPSDVGLVLGSGETLDTPEGIVPLVRLSNLFGLLGAGQGGRQDCLVLLVSDGVALTGLVVSEVIGQRQIVIKSLGAGLGAVPGVSGAAILPDGRVGLILDIHAIVRQTHSGKRTGKG